MEATHLRLVSKCIADIWSKEGKTVYEEPGYYILLHVFLPQLVLPSQVIKQVVQSALLHLKWL